MSQKSQKSSNYKQGNKPASAPPAPPPASIPAVETQLPAAPVSPAAAVEVAALPETEIVDPVHPEDAEDYRPAFMISADQVRGLIQAVAAGKAHVLPELVAELADAIAQGRAPGVGPVLFQELKSLLPGPPEPVVEKRALVRVRFIESMLPYAAGDLAGFERPYAEQLVAKQLAVYE